MNAVLGPRLRKGASALCCFMRPVVGLRERPGFDAPFSFGVYPCRYPEYECTCLRIWGSECHFPNYRSSLLLIHHRQESIR